MSMSFKFVPNDRESRKRKVGPDGLTKDQRYYRSPSPPLDSGTTEGTSAEIFTTLTVGTVAHCPGCMCSRHSATAIPMIAQPIQLLPTTSTEIHIEPTVPLTQKYYCEVEVQTDTSEDLIKDSTKPQLNDSKLETDTAADTELRRQFEAPQTTTIWDEDLWLGQHVPEDVWCRTLKVEWVNKPRRSMVPIPEVSRLRGRQDIEFIAEMEKLRRHVIQWASAWGGVMVWDDSLDYFFQQACLVNEDTIYRLVSGLWRKATLGRAIYAELLVWCQKGLPDNPVALWSVWQEIQELMKVTITGVARIEVRLHILKQGVFSWRRGNFDAFVNDFIGDQLSDDIKAELWIESFLRGVPSHGGDGIKF
ncbi:hypothetical protein CPB83DRAFT_900736 [Crepidotus variabilis]|uniref:Uncharacterized protein n=1 Tax=Crepidotus variabilis TaxID=179855 RepID=A0A9P6BE16_9AGAR|nr:hypothetical protein CPB83DRAFT_900736 [Crepidotus variabilis]